LFGHIYKSEPALPQLQSLLVSQTENMKKSLVLFALLLLSVLDLGRAKSVSKEEEGVAGETDKTMGLAADASALQ
jgi:hypothetical protein